MAFLALAPLAEMAGAAAMPAIESLIGAESAKVLTPVAKKALTSIAGSKAASSLAHKLGNHFFGGKSKTARKLIKKGGKVAGVLASKQTHKLIEQGLNVGQGLGMLDSSQANSILDAHSKAMSVHDQLSAFNQKHDPLSPKFDMGKAVAAAADAAQMAGLQSHLGAVGALADPRPRQGAVIPSQLPSRMSYVAKPQGPSARLERYDASRDSIRDHLM